MTAHPHVEKLSNEIQETLELDDFESKIYLSLLRSGPVSASALAKDLNIDRATTYRTVDKLVDMDFVSTTFSNPRLCTAVEPENVFKSMLEKKQGEARKIKNNEKTIIEKITRIRFCPNQGPYMPILRVIQGRDNIYSDISHLIEDCFETVFIATTLEDLAKMYHSLIPEKIKSCKEKRGKVMLLVEGDIQKLIPFARRFNATEIRTCKLPSKGRIVVQKNKQMIMSDSSQSGARPENDLSISTDAIDMVNNIDGLCRLLWKSAKPLDL